MRQYGGTMTKQIRNTEAEITTMIAQNRSNCDFICHALLENGMDEELVRDYVLSSFENRQMNKI